MNKILELAGVQVAFKKGNVETVVIHDNTFDVYENEIVGLIGESGSGKSLSSLSIMGLLPEKAFYKKGSILFNGVDLTQLSEPEYRKIRGKEIGMIFQEPMSSLNPSMRCGLQVAEVLQEHTHQTELEVKEVVLQLFEKVKLANPLEVYGKYPHELSGGQKQRIMIAMAIACKPKLLIADEPTTALDVTVQKEILVLLKTLQEETKMSILFITHDLGLISNISNRIMVMYQGRLVEQGRTDEVLKRPKDLYTQALIQSRPNISERLRKLPTVNDFLDGVPCLDRIEVKERQDRLDKLYEQEPLLRVVDVEMEFISSKGFLEKSRFKALKGVSLDVYEGETLGLVGESGCGKSTLGNVILQLAKPTRGAVYYKGVALGKLGKKALREMRREIQIIFQDPFASLNPKKTIGEAIVEPMLVHGLYKTRKESRVQALYLLHAVGLHEEAFDKYPHEFSGGQRQRIGIARTIALKPKLIICDESVSALDISVQAQVLNLLNDLKEQFQFTYLFISHDLAVVKYISDSVIVMHEGSIVEYQEADRLFENPTSIHTQKLIEAIPS